MNIHFFFTWADFSLKLPFFLEKKFPSKSSLLLLLLLLLPFPFFIYKFCLCSYFLNCAQNQFSVVLWREKKWEFSHVSKCLENIFLRLSLKLTLYIYTPSQKKKFESRSKTLISSYSYKMYIDAAQISLSHSLILNAINVSKRLFFSSSLLIPNKHFLFYEFSTKKGTTTKEMRRKRYLSGSKNFIYSLLFGIEWDGELNTLHKRRKKKDSIRRKTRLRP